ncbi:MAG: carbohydrate kinase [Acidimicrobiia bacterium]|nr:carbohydrate kinase [Acidimicrobiia bacterium]
MSGPAGRRALACGEALIDEFPGRRVVAGAPLHVAAHLASMGWEAGVVARVGDDADGRAIRERLERAGVGASLLEVDPVLPTGTVAITLDPEGSPTFDIRRPAAWDALEGPAVIPPHGVFYFGSPALRDPRCRNAVARLLTAGAIRLVDANLRPPDYDAACVRFCVTHADVFNLSSGELPEVTALLGVAADPRALFAFGPQWICITRGAAGAELHHRDGRAWEVPGEPAEVVDTVGAGDAFLAGLADGLLHTGDGAEALRRAQRAATAIVRQRGGFPEREPPGRLLPS